MRRSTALTTARASMPALRLILPMTIAGLATGASAQTVVVGSERPSVEINWEAIGIPSGAYGAGTRFETPPLYDPAAGAVRSRVLDLPGATRMPPRAATPQPAVPPPPEAARSRIVELPSPPARQPADVLDRPAPRGTTAAGDVVPRPTAQPIPGGAPQPVTPEQMAERRASQQQAAVEPVPAVPRPSGSPDAPAVAAPVESEPPRPAPTEVERTRTVEAAPQPAPPPEAEPRPPETRTAAVEARAPVPVPSPEPASDGMLRLLYESGAEAMPAGAEDTLAPVVAALRADESARLQLRAYAEGDAATASAARRLSLFRALKVREHLIEQGIKATRIDVRALGTSTGEGPADRVEIVMMR